MDRTWRVLELLAAKTRIEETLIASGIQVDAACREGIDRALEVFVEKANLDIEEAEMRVVMAFIDAMALRRAA